MVETQKMEHNIKTFPSNSVESFRYVNNEFHEEVFSIVGSCGMENFTGNDYVIRDLSLGDKVLLHGRYDFGNKGLTRVARNNNIVQIKFALIRASKWSSELQEPK